MISRIGLFWGLKGLGLGYLRETKEGALSTSVCHSLQYIQNKSWEIICGMCWNKLKVYNESEKNYLRNIFALKMHIRILPKIRTPLKMFQCSVEC
jgi:hypothetical protein